MPKTQAAPVADLAPLAPFGTLEPAPYQPPAPHYGNTPHVPPTNAVAAPLAYAGGAPLTAVIALVAPNPKRPGSAAHARYALYPAAGATLGDAVRAGVTKADLLWDLRRGYVQLA